MRKRSGFTLIEVLLVIAVIALLMAVLLPSLQRARRQAKSVVCQSNLKQWTTIFSAYISNNESMLPKQKFYDVATPEPWMYTLQEFNTSILHQQARWIRKLCFSRFIRKKNWT